MRRLDDARRPPPYARQLRGESVYVFGGHTAWNKAAIARREALVLPDGVDPFSIRWPVAGRLVTASWPGASLKDARRLVEALEADGASRVILVDPIFYDTSEPEQWRWDV
jgi:hypothetical protein